MSSATPSSYTATYRRSAFAKPTLLLVLLFYFAVLAWAISSVATVDLLIFVVAATGVTILATLAVALAAFRVHGWSIEAAGLRIAEGPKLRFTGFTKLALLPWTEIVALRRIESVMERLIEIELRGGAVHRMAQQLLANADGRRCIPDHAGLDALQAAISERLAAAGVAAFRAEEGLSFWNRLPGLVFLGLMFALSLLIAAAAVIGLSSGTNYYGAVLKGAALVLLLPLGAGYLIFRSLKRRQQVLKSGDSLSVVRIQTPQQSTYGGVPGI